MKVFRNLRLKFLTSGKIKSYLIYALGEILLIVIGILIAWKINNLNEIRKNNIIQEKIYVSLFEELNTNLIELDSAIVRYQNHKTSLQSSLNFVGIDPKKLNKEDKDLIIEIKFRSTSLRNEALSSINNTDKFQFLENESLKELIAQYPLEINKFKEQETKIKNIADNRLKPVLEKYISLIDMLSQENTLYNNIRTYGQESNYEALLNSKVYQNSVIDNILQIQIQLSIGEALKKKTQTLAIKLQKELQGKSI